ncbi:ferritin-like domain-containing protein [Adhaeribacter soli]|uniref:PA2169 family four-helix-bundle protein n=1 Tax=Adhaeribacter soli TaxID=2607655 RepID=A0A5N1J5V0_9BACT|nr:PA2169 family four-helix-bundle protein [Adhaeribacter soli]KAA9346070.1 PA2169 family four-helix-bundle protein [Adhaeribacter soli]
MDKEKDIVAVVHHLIERCKDGSKGYFTAAEDVEDQELKSLFKNYSVQRDSMITELQNELHKMGKSDSEHSSIEGTVHRAWIDLTSALASKDRKRILAECERGEDYAVAAYKKAMSADLPPNLHQIIGQQYQQVQQAHDQIRNLRDQA